MAYTWVVWLNFSHEVETRCQFRLQLPEGLTETGGYASKMAHSHTWQVSAGC